MDIEKYFPKPLDIEFLINGYSDEPIDGEHARLELIRALTAIGQGEIPYPPCQGLDNCLWQLFVSYRVLIWGDKLTKSEQEQLGISDCLVLEYAREIVETASRKYVRNLNGFQLIVTDDYVVRERFRIGQARVSTMLILYLLKCFSFSHCKPENQKRVTCVYCGKLFLSEAHTRPYRYCPDCRIKYGRDALYKRKARCDMKKAVEAAKKQEKTSVPE